MGGVDLESFISPEPQLSQVPVRHLSLMRRGPRLVPRPFLGRVASRDYGKLIELTIAAMVAASAASLEPVSSEK
jgi:hypothetical protein